VEVFRPAADDGGAGEWVGWGALEMAESGTVVALGVFDDRADAEAALRKRVGQVRKVPHLAEQRRPPGISGKKSGGRRGGRRYP
jgi:hypothetical protein